MRFLPKTLLILLASANLLAAGCTVSTVRPHESSIEESSLAENSDDIVVVPAERPSELNLRIPDGFTEKSSEYCNQFYVCDDASIIITSEQQSIHGIRLDEFAEETKFSYEHTADNYVLCDEQKLQIDNKDCVLLDFTYDIIGEDKTQTMHALTALFMENDTKYAVTCKSRTETFGSYSGIFRRAIETVTIAEPPAETSVDMPPIETLPATESGTETNTEPAF